MPPKDLNEYVDWILDQKPNLQNVDAEVKEQLRHDFVGRLEDQINAAIVAEMSEAQIGEFERVLDTQNPEAIQAYCTKAVPNTADIVAEVLLRFKTQYLGA
jgi:hypothetical protein